MAVDSVNRPGSYGSRQSVVRAPEGIVATSQPLAAQAGLEAMRQGGNAFDGAVTASAVLGVVEPMMSGPGGDLFAMYRTEDGELGALSSGGPAPRAADPTSVREAMNQETGDGTPSMPHRGPLSVVVPGCVKGWKRLLEAHGRRSLGEALEPAVRYAREGFPVTEVIAEYWAFFGELLEEGPGRTMFMPGGSAPAPGEVVRLPQLGRTLERIAREGPGVFYRGEVAGEIVREVQSRGGLLEGSDLERFEPVSAEPVTTTYGDRTIFELPAPNQGPIALEAFNLAKQRGVREAPPGSVERTHGLIESMRTAFEDGRSALADPEFVDVPDLADPEYAADRVRSDPTEPSGSAGTTAAPKSGDTVLVTAADGAGNVVSCISSLFNGFGSGLVAGETGVVLQNRGASFSLDPDDPNCIAPGKRPFHTLIPALIRKDDRDWTAFGVMGGLMQPQGHLQVLDHLVDGECTLQEALDRPRWRWCEDGSVAVEARMDDDLLDGLVRRGHTVRVQGAAFFGGGQMARFQDGVLCGATDPRKDGAAVGF